MAKSNCVEYVIVVWFLMGVCFIGAGSNLDSADEERHPKGVWYDVPIHYPYDSSEGCLVPVHVNITTTPVSFSIQMVELDGQCVQTREQLALQGSTISINIDHQPPLIKCEKGIGIVPTCWIKPDMAWYSVLFIALGSIMLGLLLFFAWCFKGFTHPS